MQQSLTALSREQESRLQGGMTIPRYRIIFKAILRTLCYPFSHGSALPFASLLLVVVGWLGAGIHAAAAEPLTIFVSILPQKYFVERIGGNRVRVSVMVKAGRSPETYAPTPRQMVRLSQAQIYFRIGVPFEDAWLESIATANPKMRVVNLRQGISVLPLPAEDRHGAIDPHIWTSPPLVEKMAARIYTALAAIDPAHQAEFEENYHAFIQDLERLDSYIRKTLAGITHRQFLVFHPAWRYFAHTYGLTEIAIEQAGKEPSAKSLATLIEQAQREDIQVIFVQKQFSRTHAEVVARAIGAKIIPFDPLAEDYIHNLRQVANTLARVLQ